MRNPDNYCYCPEFNQCATRNATIDEWAPEACYEHCKDGFLRVGKCYGVPVIMSAPHFYNVDKSILTQIDGVNPVQELHDTYLDIEPTTGITLAAHKRIQVNFRMQPYRHFAATKNLPIVELFPVLWADEGADLDEENEKKFKDMVVTPALVVNGLAIGAGMVLGAVLFVLGLFLVVKAAKS